MKKLLFAAIAALGFTFANAQPVQDQSHLLASLCLENVIYMVPQVDMMGAKFQNAFDYSAPFGKELEDLWGNDVSPFWVSSNRNFNVTIKAGSPYFFYFGTGTGNNLMPAGVLDYKVASNFTGGLSNGLWHQLGVLDQTIISGGEYGFMKPFSIKLRATPGWNYTGGVYTMDVVLTATQQ
ncbi:MAG TPA: hypothetical protein VF145_07720 [Chitinophagaceae bacterium]